MTRYIRIPAAPESDLARPARIRMRDGVLLAADIYLPSDGGDRAGDTILIRLPYDKSGTYTYIPLIAEYLMARGYRVVAQDVRGKFRSEGEALLFVNEVRDGEDTLDWIVQQPWSNGRVAMWGDSYYGYTQWAAAASGHPALKAIAPRVTGTRLGEPVHRAPGERVSDVEWAITYLYPVSHFHGNDTYLWEPDWTRRDFAAQVEDFLAEAGERSISYDQWYPRPVHLPRFPLGSPFAGRSVPALHTIGWWDNCSPLSWADVDDIAKSPAWAAHHHLRIESIDHEGYELLSDPADRVAERTDDQVRALLPRTLDPALEFFEVYLRGHGAPSDIPAVRWNLAGTTEERTDAAWPPAGIRTVTLQATAEGGLRTDAAEQPTELTWTHDPDDLVPSSAEDAFSFLLEMPDDAPIGARGDVLVFTSSPVAADVDLAGPVSATATVRSDGPVLDLFVRLLDVSPDGTALRIARGQRQIAEATTPATIDIGLGQIGYRLQAGHCLRVHVSSSDYPEFIPQTGTGADPWAWGPTATNQQHLTVGGPDGLTIHLPVLDGELS
ncbi:Cocaine esterase [Microbacterium sp. Bi98]|uniref:CocE/NonD family hydrolase n=1 Tax=unclassified Microbacterium TaxID=2609290 RepID=UPI0006FFD97B|nr:MULTISPECIES: CocE/NonD family hydrolase [unclassified Microbacterium]KRD50420.1 X-Pro dipeptidyl-peptidase [Microbacterium sp. Root280D1]CAH0212281.1 Cocaine esterase [Microbacterium sp. Bi98]